MEFYYFWRKEIKWKSCDTFLWVLQGMCLFIHTDCADGRQKRCSCSETEFWKFCENKYFQDHKNSKIELLLFPLPPWKSQGRPVPCLASAAGSQQEGRSSGSFFRDGDMETFLSHLPARSTWGSHSPVAMAVWGRREESKSRRPRRKELDMSNSGSWNDVCRRDYEMRTDRKGVGPS